MLPPRCRLRSLSGWHRVLSSLLRMLPPRWCLTPFMAPRQSVQQVMTKVAVEALRGRLTPSLPGPNGTWTQRQVPGPHEIRDRLAEPRLEPVEPVQRMVLGEHR